MRAAETCATGLSILLTLVVPADAQVQQSVTQPQTMTQQPSRVIGPAANKARLTNRFHQLSNQYGALTPATAQYAHALHPALRQTRSKIVSTAREIDELKQQIKNKLDSMSEMGEMESLRLQTAMNRLSKLMSTLANLLKKASETNAAITKNIK